MQPLSQNRSCRAARRKEVRIAEMQLLFSACLHWPRVLRSSWNPSDPEQSVTLTYTMPAALFPLFLAGCFSYSCFTVPSELSDRSSSASHLLHLPTLNDCSFSRTEWNCLYTHHGWPKGENSDEHLSWLRRHLKNLQTRCTKSLMDLLQRIWGGNSCRSPAAAPVPRTCFWERTDHALHASLTSFLLALTSIQQLTWLTTAYLMLSCWVLHLCHSLYQITLHIIK